MANESESIEQVAETTPAVVVRNFGHVRKSMLPTTRANDPFGRHYKSDGDIVQPPYHPVQLALMVEISDVLSQCISAMATNIDGPGYDLELNKGLDIDNLPEEAAREREQLRLLFNFPNFDQNFTDLRIDTRVDLETSGNGYWEIVRSQLGEILEIHHLPAITMRITCTDKEFTDFIEPIRLDDGTFIDVPRSKRFRRFVQLTEGGAKKIYFKEFGDPRTIDALTGKVSEGTQTPATEVLWFKIPSTHTPYGIPRWISASMWVGGARKAQEVNYLFFDNKSIPPIIIAVSGGALTTASLKRLEEVFDKEIKGLSNFHKGLVLEATPTSAPKDLLGEKVSPVKIDVQPLTAHIQKDGLFLDYNKTARNVQRSKFKLPPLYTGDTDDYTRATAKESQIVAEEQAFSPARNQFDAIINRRILSDLRINNWTFKSLGVKTSDDVDVVNAMGAVKEAIRIQDINDAVSDMRNVPRTELPPEIGQLLVGQLFQAPTPFDQNNQDNQGEEVVKTLVTLRERLQQRTDEMLVNKEIKLKGKRNGRLD